MRKIFTLAMLLIVSLSATPLIRAASSGTCGENLTWTLDDDGNLVIEGVGEMNDYDNSGPWGSNVKTVKIAQGVTSIGRYAFCGSSMTDVFIANTIETVGERAFDTCTKLQRVEITDLGAWCGIKFEFLANPLGYAQHLYLNGEEIIELVIPEGVKSIGQEAFKYCSNFTSVKIPESVVSIGKNAFIYCYGLTSIEIPSSVSFIGNSAFGWCSSLTSIKVDKDNKYYDSREYCNAIIETATNTMLVGCKNTIIPNTVKFIDGAFSGCKELTYMEIPSSVTGLGDFTFSHCDNLTNIILPNTIETIGNYAFQRCSNLKKIKLPGSVKSIGYGAFLFSDNLTIVEIDDLKAWCKIDFKSEQSNPLKIAHSLYMNGNEVTNLVIPEGVTDICQYAFSYCYSLVSVTLPNSVESVGLQAFLQCRNITNIVVGNSLKNLGNAAFSLCKNLTKFRCYTRIPPVCADRSLLRVKDKCILEVPDESIEAYRTTAPWSEFVNIVGIETGGIGDVDADENDVRISVEGGEIIVDGIADNEVMEVYNISGTVIYYGSAKSVNVPTSGVYVVRVAGKTAKVLIH